MGGDMLTTVKEAVVGFILLQSHWLLVIVGTGNTTPAGDPVLQPVNAGHGRPQLSSKVEPLGFSHAWRLLQKHKMLAGSMVGHLSLILVCK